LISYIAQQTNQADAKTNNDMSEISKKSTYKEDRKEMVEKKPTDKTSTLFISQYTTTPPVAKSMSSQGNMQNAFIIILNSLMGSCKFNNP